MLAIKPKLKITKRYGTSLLNVRFRHYRCEYVDRWDGDGQRFERPVHCRQQGVLCYYPPYGHGSRRDKAYFCYDHMADSGFCVGCQEFWAGVETFEFSDRKGFCENCVSEMDDEDDDWIDDEDGIYFWD